MYTYIYFISTNAVVKLLLLFVLFLHLQQLKPLLEWRKERGGKERETSQLEGPTPDNTFGFKLSESAFQGGAEKPLVSLGGLSLSISLSLSLSLISFSLSLSSLYIIIFLLAAIFSPVHPYIGSTTVLPDIYMYVNSAGPALNFDER